MQICIRQHMINQSPVGFKGLAQQLFAASQQECPGRRVFVPQKECLWGAAQGMRCRRPGAAAARGKRAWRRGRRRLFARGPWSPPHTPSASPPAAVAAKAMRTVGPIYSKHANNQNQNRTGHHDSSRHRVYSTDTLQNKNDHSVGCYIYAKHSCKSRKILDQRTTIFH